MLDLQLHRILCLIYIHWNNLLERWADRMFELLEIHSEMEACYLGRVWAVTLL